MGNSSIECSHTWQPSLNAAYCNVIVTGSCGFPIHYKQPGSLLHSGHAALSHTCSAASPSMPLNLSSSESARHSMSCKYCWNSLHKNHISSSNNDVPCRWHHTVTGRSDSFLEHPVMLLCAFVRKCTAESAVRVRCTHPALHRIGKRAAMVPAPLLSCSSVPAPVSPHHCNRICGQASPSQHCWQQILHVQALTVVLNVKV